MGKNKISVIVAVYNTEKYIERCLNSLVNQTYDNLEIIVVDDCSTDNSKKIINKYKNNKKIKILFNKKNSGAGYSRNVALKIASGEYIGFIDSDDYVQSDYYEKLMNSIVKNDSDISICDMKLVFDNTKYEQLAECYINDFNLLNVVNNGLAASPCNKLFKRSLITKYQFAVGKMNEDIAVVIPTLVNAKKISYAPDCYYYYYQRMGSVQNSSFSEKKFDIFDAVDTTLERIKDNKNFKELSDAIIFNQLILLFVYVIPKEKNFKKRKQILKKFNELSSKYNLRENKGYHNLLKNSGKRHEAYYELLFKSVENKHYFFGNCLISIYKPLFYLKHKELFVKKSVIKDNIDLESIVDVAKKQYYMTEPEITVSVVVPNYNYSRFMYQRIYSILNQNYKIKELIILDDYSKDDSIEVINNMTSKIKKYINIKTIFNTENSGSTFKQWKKGFDNAIGDYVWIAEADDYCEKSLLKNLINPIKKDKNIVISYSDTAFVDVNGMINLKSIKPEIDIQKSGHWDKSFINKGIDEIMNYSYLNCTIANVSSCIFKNKNYDKYLIESGKYHQAGDWLFYLNVMGDGNISYINKPINYYRLHYDNVSSVMKKQAHFEEIKKIHKYLDNKYKLNNIQKGKIKERYKFLKKVWKVK